MNSLNLHTKLAGALSKELAGLAGGAPDRKITARIAERSAEWGTLGRMLCQPRVEPECSAEAIKEVADCYGSTATTWGVSRPADIYTFRLSGELIAPPPNFEERVRSSKQIKLIFEGANGGDGRAADRMIQVLRDHGAPVYGHVIDSCSSAHCDLFVLGCDRRTMAADAALMIHSSRALCFGSADSLEKTAADLRRMDFDRALDYVQTTGQLPDVVRHWFDGRDYWFDAETAVEFGLTDEILPPAECCPSRGDPPAPAAVAAS